jgi:hypothetical protein
MKREFERDDSGIRVHERGVIAQLCSLFRSHEHGLPELFKNASTAYARNNAPTDLRILTLFFGSHEGTRYLALLDLAGMTVEDLEQRFANWGDPEAHVSAHDTDEILEGGHGNGGKCYMTQMFDYSYLYTVRNGRGSKYGFLGDDPHPGYFPNRHEGRGFPVDRPIDAIKRALAQLGIEFSRLPEQVRTTAAAAAGFTLAVGVAPKHSDERDFGRKLVDMSIQHPQMSLTSQNTQIYVIADGRPLTNYCPVVLPEIEPHEHAPEPRLVTIPDLLEDPTTGESCATRSVSEIQGQLILRTSKTSMRWSHKGRHHIRYTAHGKPIAFLKMENVSRSAWVDRFYGECRLDALAQYETPDRSVLAEAPLTRAVESWIREQVFEYESAFKTLERLTASQEHRKQLTKLNDILDEWKNRFLQDTYFGSGVGTESAGRPPRPPRRPLPEGEAASIAIEAPFARAGVGVWVNMRVRFLDANGTRVAPPAFMWHSNDWAVATVDQEHRVVTHTPGEVEVWVETVDRRLRSRHVHIQVIDSASARIEPTSITVQAGKVEQLNALVTDRDGREHTDVSMTWLQEDSGIVGVTGNGRVIGQRAGTTEVFAVDERCLGRSKPCTIEVTAASVSSGGPGGNSFPKILVSEVNADPLNPDGESVHLSPDDGPVHQPTPQHVEHNIWWINLACPLARFYFSKGVDSREWRQYHMERYIEALVKIRLNLDFQLAEEEITFDGVERRWREVAADIQRHAMEDLKPLLEGDDLDE